MKDNSSQFNQLIKWLSVSRDNLASVQNALSQIENINDELNNDDIFSQLNVATQALNEALKYTDISTEIDELRGYYEDALSEVSNLEDRVYSLESQINKN